MKTHSRKSHFARAGIFIAIAGVTMLCGCEQPKRQSISAAEKFKPIDPLAVVLAPHAGTTRIDAEIRERQSQVRAGSNIEIDLERLGWLFVAKARETFDPGFYKLAEQCALGLNSRNAGSPEALLLRGHALQSQHRFHEAESLARELVKKRGLAFDHGLLGDILVDVGRVDEAVDAYQTMLDLKPDPQGYARAAHVRWLKGDLTGALELMRMAARGASPRDAESAAWMHTQLARYLWQSQQNVEASRALEIALEVQTNYAPALLLRGRMLLSAGHTDRAVQSLRVAAAANPLPEYHWALAEALRSAGQEMEARSAESQITRSGAWADPRTCSLYLATRRENTDIALQLAQAELEDRTDIFTHDALAWAFAAAGKMDEAQAEMSRALSHRTQDARLYFHAAIIARKAGKLAEAHDWLKKANAFESMLLPSEAAQLRAAASSMDQPTLSRVSADGSTKFPAVVKESTATEN